ncbi:MAG: MarR family transcriptional regulator, partial [Flavobacteriales bacterium]
MKKNPVDFENSIGPWIGKTTKIVDYHMQEAMASHGLDLSKEQMIGLKKLQDRDGLNQNELAALTYRDKSSLARLLSKMEQKNYIIRKQCIEDRRINKIYLTEKGEEIFRRTRPLGRQLILMMEKNISADEKATMIDVLKRVQSNLIGQG